MKDPRIEPVLLSLCAARGPDRSICPSEVARALAEDWRPLMPDVRSVAARLAEEGRVLVLQRGKAVDARTARGPIRLSAPAT